jgi:hypothetical protein
MGDVGGAECGLAGGITEIGKSTGILRSVDGTSGNGDGDSNESDVKRDSSSSRLGDLGRLNSCAEGQE